MNKRCCFAGHSHIDNRIDKNKLKDIIIELIENEGVYEFWVGNYGYFDSVSAEAVRELKSIYSQISLVLVIPYLTKEINDNKKSYHSNYDYILHADIPDSTPKKYRIIKTNEYMVNNSDFLICYVQHCFGGAAKTLEYARKKKHIKIINIDKRYMQ